MIIQTLGNSKSEARNPKQIQMFKFLRNAWGAGEIFAGGQAKRQSGFEDLADASRSVFKKILEATCALILFFILARSAGAQAQQGITVIPSIQNVDLATDPPEYSLTYINQTNATIKLTLSAQDFEELEEGYKLSFLQGKEASNYKYSLSSWISFENKNIELTPKERKTVKVFIDKNRITKGGHYASILAKIEGNENKKEVNVKAILSSLLFVRASTGKEVESGKIVSVRLQRDLLDFPETINVRFENNGNVYVTPHGLIEVYDPLGNFVAKGIINEESGVSLPESIRLFQTPLKSNSKLLLPGIYKMNITFAYGKTNQKIQTSTKFFSQGSLPLLLIVPILLSIIGFIYFKRRSTSSQKQSRRN